MSRVPWTRSLGLSAIDAFPLRFRRKNTSLLLIVKRRTAIVFTSGGSKPRRWDGYSDAARQLV